MELVALKVKIGLRPNGHHDFPAFNQLNSNVRDGIDWSIFIDRFGGWHYDQVSGHDNEDVESPRGNWNGMFLVPDDFAQAAIAMFPESCTILNEADAEKFYNERGHVRDAEIKEDTTILQAIAAKVAIGIPQSPSDLDALDPDHPASGRRRNKKKTFSGFKMQQGFTVKV